MGGAASASRVLRFGVFEVDLCAGELHKQGLKVKLQPQPFQILTILLEHPGELVTREEIRRRLWPSDTFVDFEHSLNTSINKLREALGEEAGKPHYIETLSRRGYRFIGHVERIETIPPAPAAETSHQSAAIEVGAGLVPALERDGERLTSEGHPGFDFAQASTSAQPALSPVEGHRPEPVEGQGARPRKPWIVVLSAGAVVALMAVLFALNVAGLRDRLLHRGAALPKIESIAVLPLENLSHDPDQEYFADGMTEALITDLGKIGALRVISRQSVMHYKGSKKPLPEIARELNVDGIIEGSVQRSGSRVRVTANLLHAPTDRHLWTESYERELGDVLALQSHLARAIARQIQIKLAPKQQARLASAPTIDPEAYDLYLKARYFWNKRTGDTVKKSVDYFEQALGKDPGFALVYAGLADAYRILGTYEFLPPKQAYPKAKAAAQRALEIDPTLAEAHTSLASIRTEYDWDFLAAEDEFKRAIQLDPNYATAHHWYADYLSWVGRQDEALAEIERARQLDPLSLIINSVVGARLYYARRYEEAIRQFQRTLEMDPNFALAHYYLADAYAETSRLPEAIAEAQKAASLTGAAPYYVVHLARVYAAAGKTGPARALLKDVSSQAYVPAHGVALAYIALDEHGKAFTWLEKAVEDRSPQLVSLKIDPAVDPLRSDPRFQDILRRMNFPP